MKNVAFKVQENVKGMLLQHLHLSSLINECPEDKVVVMRGHRKGDPLWTKSMALWYQCWIKCKVGSPLGKKASFLNLENLP